MLKVGAKNPHFTVEKEVRNLILLKEISYAKSSPRICITICKLLAPEYQMTCPSKAITGSPVCFPVLAWPLSYPPPNSHSSDSCSVFPTFQLHCHLWLLTIRPFLSDQFRNQLHQKAILVPWVKWKFSLFRFYYMDNCWKFSHLRLYVTFLPSFFLPCN